MKNRKNNKGFSLVEMIVVIAIMAVMVGVLAPTLMRYVEKARVSKDIAAIGEVKNAVQLAVNEETVFNAIRDAEATATGEDADKTLSIEMDFEGGSGKVDLGAAGCNELEAEVAKTISTISLTSSAMKESIVTVTAVEANGKVTVTVTATGIAADSEATTPFKEAFGDTSITSVTNP